MRAIRWIPAVPVALGTVAGALFLWQGGFGGGHGDFDRAIGLLGMPGFLVTAFLPLWPSDFLGAILLPAIMNVVGWFGVMHLVVRGSRIVRRT